MTCSFPWRACSILLLAGSLQAQGPTPSRPEVQAFAQRMAKAHGFDPVALAAQLGAVEPLPRVLELVIPAPQPAPKNWVEYRARFLDAKRIRLGTAFWRRHARDLARAEKTYGVPAEVIVGILGVETMYGTRMGTFSALRALTTLAFDLPDTPALKARRELFAQQLEELLLWCRETGQDPSEPLGSYAGAIGIPQFLPGSIRAYAVDFDRNGRIDLRRSPVDAIGSVAAFLQAHGWEARRPVVWRLEESPEVQAAATGKADGDPLPKRRVGDLQAAGIRPALPERVVRQEADTPVILIDLPTPGQPTQYALGFRNFYAITRYNRSFFYAMSVVELGRAVKAKAGRR